jgi:hypothetical protein
MLQVISWPRRFGMLIAGQGVDYSGRRRDD